MDSNRWKVHVSLYKNSIRMLVVKDYVVHGSWYATMPNFVERLLGITFEYKLEEAYKKAKKFAEEKNRRDDVLTKAIEDLREKEKLKR